MSKPFKFSLVITNIVTAVLLCLSIYSFWVYDDSVSNKFGKLSEDSYYIGCKDMCGLPDMECRFNAIDYSNVIKQIWK